VTNWKETYRLEKGSQTQINERDEFWWKCLRGPHINAWMALWATVGEKISHILLYLDKFYHFLALSDELLVKKRAIFYVEKRDAGRTNTSVGHMSPAGVWGTWTRETYRYLGSILSTFYVQLLRMQIPKALKDTAELTVFFTLLGSTSLKAVCKMLVKLTPDRYILTIEEWKWLEYIPLEFR